MKNIVATVLFFLALPVAAQDLDFTVCELNAEGDNDIYLAPCETHISSSCGDGWIHWNLDNTKPSTIAMLNNATTALVMDKQIKVRFDGCSAGFDKVIMLRLLND